MVLDGDFFLLFGGFARESNYGSLYLDYYYHSCLLFKNGMDWIIAKMKITFLVRVKEQLRKWAGVEERELPSSRIEDY